MNENTKKVNYFNEFCDFLHILFASLLNTIVPMRHYNAQRFHCVPFIRSTFHLGSNVPRIIPFIHMYIIIICWLCSCSLQCWLSHHKNDDHHIYTWWDILRIIYYCLLYLGYTRICVHGSATIIIFLIYVYDYVYGFEHNCI